MPFKPLGPCTTSGCPRRAIDHGKCALHATERRRQYDDQRGTSTERGYGAAWRKIRDAFLARNPLCVDCLDEGKQVAATDVDHKIPRAKGGTDDPSNLQALCHKHHSIKTSKHDRLGRTQSRP